MSYLNLEIFTQPLSIAEGFEMTNHYQLSFRVEGGIFLDFKTRGTSKMTSPYRPFLAKPLNDSNIFH